MSRFDEEPDADPHGECAAEIHRLQAQVEALTAEINYHKNHFSNLKIEYDDLYDDHEKLTAELAGYKKDAERYRWWVRVVTDSRLAEVEDAFKSIAKQIIPPTAEQFAACIDAAIAKGTA